MNKLLLIVGILSVGILGLVLAFEPPHHSSQKTVVTGNVYDVNTGNWIVGVSVRVNCAGIQRTTKTDGDGAFAVVINNGICFSPGQEIDVTVLGQTEEVVSQRLQVDDHQTLVAVGLFGRSIMIDNIN
jgi:hypothetical protein